MKRRVVLLKSWRPAADSGSRVEVESRNLLIRIARENYEWYLASDHWQALRRLALEHHGRACGQCGATTRLQVHHVNHRRLGYEELGDLRVVCRECHERRHLDAAPQDRVPTAG